MNRTPILFVLVCVSMFTEAVIAQDSPSNAEMAKKLANPTNAIASLTSNIDFVEYDGDLPEADDQRG